MKFKVGIDVEAWFMAEVEADDPRRAATQARDQVAGINTRLQEAGITWLAIESKSERIVVTDGAGKCSVFGADEEENTDRSSARSNL